MQTKNSSSRFILILDVKSFYKTPNQEELLVNLGISNQLVRSTMLIWSAYSYRSGFVPQFLSWRAGVQYRDLIGLIHLLTSEIPILTLQDWNWGTLVSVLWPWTTHWVSLIMWSDCDYKRMIQWEIKFAQFPHAPLVVKKINQNTIYLFILNVEIVDEIDFHYFWKKTFKNQTSCTFW